MLNSDMISTDSQLVETAAKNSNGKDIVSCSNLNNNDDKNDLAHNDCGDVPPSCTNCEDTIGPIIDNQLVMENNTDSNLSSTDALGSRMALNTFKAGMDGLDKEKINNIIQGASKGSKFYKNESKKQALAAERNELLKNEMQALTKLQLSEALKQANKDIEMLEMSRDMLRVIVHVDMDAFYAAVHMKEQPHLKDIPMAVGGNSMLATSNYHARKFGVRAGMPGFIAKKLCPHLVMVSSDYSKYKEESKLVKNVLATYDPEFCSMGLDEAYLDITEHLVQRTEHFLSNANDKVNYSKIFDGLDIHSVDQYWDRELVERVVQEMRSQITEVTQLTASAGISPNKMLSKICSDMNKPNGQYFLNPDRQNIIEFVRSLKVQKVCGIGKVTAETLRVLGIITIQDMYDKLAELKILMSELTYNSFIRISLGIGSHDWSDKSDRKSMSCERTFGEISDPQELSNILLDLSKNLSDDLKRKYFKGVTITLKYKTVDFEVRTRAITIDNITNSEDIIYEYSNKLLRKEIESVKPHKLKLRLMGVRMSGFQKSYKDLIMDSEINNTSNYNNVKRRKLKHIDLNATNTISDFFINSNIVHDSSNADFYNTTSEFQTNCIDKLVLDTSPPSPLTFSNSQLKYSIMESVENKGNTSCIISDTSLPSSTAPPLQDQSLQATCPVCSLYIAGDNNSINKHIDTCLNIGFISSESEPRGNINSSQKVSSTNGKQRAKHKRTSSVKNSQSSLKSFFS